MKYVESITDFFKSPKWVMNLLFCAVCSLIPIVGPMVLLGWLITVLWIPRTVDMATAPEFDFGKLGLYLERGLWPMLVGLAAGFGVALVVMIVGFIPSAIIGFVLGGKGFFGFIASSLTGLIWGALGISAIFVMMPLIIRAILVQDFAKSFDIPYMKNFVRLMWKEMLFVVLFAWAASIVLSFAGLIVFCVGIYAAAGLIHFMAVHLYRQIYDLYLARGGVPIPMSPKLTGEAPSTLFPPSAA